MKKLLLSAVIGCLLTVLFGVLAGFGGAACHCNTPLQVTFPYLSMLGVHHDTGLLGTLLLVGQFPVYVASVWTARGPKWKAAVLLLLPVVHIVAASIALSLP